METKKQVLVVDDEPQVTEFVSEIMQEEGWSTCAALSGAAALNSIKKQSFDLVILDLKLPDLTGFEVCRRIRKFSEVPIIVLSAIKDLEERERCVGLGANDYITKPFEIAELRFRVRCLNLRDKKGHPERQQQFDFDDGFLKISYNRREVIAGGREIWLSPREYQLLHELVESHGQLLTYEQLLTKLWGTGYKFETTFFTFALHACVLKLNVILLVPAT